MALCPVHNQEFKFVPPGVSKKTGQPYQGFWSCPEMGCRLKPNQPINPQANPTRTPSKPTQEYWEAKDAKKNDSILLQVAFKAAVELQCHHPQLVTDVYKQTLEFHKWLLSQTEGQKPARVANVAPQVHSGDLDEANKAISYAQAEMVDGDNIGF